MDTGLIRNVASCMTVNTRSIIFSTRIPGLDPGEPAYFVLVRAFVGTSLYFALINVLSGRMMRRRVLEDSYVRA